MCDGLTCSRAATSRRHAYWARSRGWKECGRVGASRSLCTGSAHPPRCSRAEVPLGRREIGIVRLVEPVKGTVRRDAVFQWWKIRRGMARDRAAMHHLAERVSWRGRTSIYSGRSINRDGGAMTGGTSTRAISRLSCRPTSEESVDSFHKDQRRPWSMSAPVTLRPEAGWLT